MTIQQTGFSVINILHNHSESAKHLPHAFFWI